MLIELSDELLERWPDLLRDARWHDALDNLGKAVIEGNHAVTASFTVVNKLLASERHQHTFRRIKAQLQRTQSLRDRLSRRVVLHAQPGPLVTRHQINTAEVLRVHYRYFATSLRTQATMLLGEDMNDALLLERAAQCHVHRTTELHGVKIHLRRRAGGGINTAVVLRDLCAEGPVLCVADSDRLAADGELGVTARKLQATADKLGEALFELHILPCHELENLLPPALLRAATERVVAPDNPVDARDLLARIDGLAGAKLLAAGPPCWFLDLKNDLSWRDTAYCGLTKRMLGLVVLYAQRPSEALATHLFSEQSDEVRDTWRTLCETILAWGCALLPLRG